MLSLAEDVRFTTNNTFTVPAGVTKITVVARGGAGGGGGGSVENKRGGRGAAGSTVTATDLGVTPNQQLQVTIGQGGKGGAGVGAQAKSGGGGGSTSVTLASTGAPLVIAGGGGGGNGAYFSSGRITDGRSATNACTRTYAQGANSATTGGIGAGNPGGAGGTGGRGENGGNGTEKDTGGRPRSVGFGGGGGAGATAGSGGVGYESAGGSGGSYPPSADCNIPNNSGTAGGPGWTKGGDGTAGEVTITYTLPPLQTISCNTDATADLTALSSINPSATVSASNGGQVGALTYSTARDSACTVEDAALKANALGVCTYNVSAATNGATAAATKLCTQGTVKGVSPNLALSFSSSTAYVNASVSGTITSNSLGEISHQATPGCNFNVNSRNVTLQPSQEGSCTLTVSQAANGVYLADEDTKSVVISKRSQTLTFATQTIAQQVYALKRTFNIAPLATNAPEDSVNRPIAYSASPATALVCSVNGTTVTLLKAGICTITADQQGNTEYAAARQATQSVTITEALPVLTWGAAPALVVGDTAKSLTATSSITAEDIHLISYSSASPEQCTVSTSGMINALKEGECTIHANQPAKSGYYQAAAQITKTITVGKTAQTLTFGTQTPSQTYTHNSSFPSPQASSSSPADATNRPITYAATPALVCALNGTSINIVKAGECTITANQKGDGSYEAAQPVTQSVTIKEALPVLTWGATPTLVVGDTAKSLSATSSITATDIRPVSYSSAFPEQCTVSATGVINALKDGDCTIHADQEASAGYYQAAVQITKTITVGKTAQTLTFDNQAPNEHDFVRDATFNVLPEATSDHADTSRPITYKSLTSAICIVTGKQVTMLEAGVCEISADQVGDSTYSAAAQVKQAVTLKSIKHFSGPTVPVAGLAATATASVTGGGNTCGFDTTGNNTAFEATPADLPAGHTGAQGQLKFKLVSCDTSEVTISIRWPEKVSHLQKFGKASANATEPSFFAPPGLVISPDGLTTTYVLRDGQLGDDDWMENGEIVDPVVTLTPTTTPTNPASTVTAVPVMDHIGLALLALMALLMGCMGLRARKVSRP